MAPLMVVDDALLQVQHNSSFLNAHYTNSAQYNRVYFSLVFFSKQGAPKSQPDGSGGDQIRQFVGTKVS